VRKALLALVVLFATLMTASSAEGPKVSLSTTRIATPGHVIVRGSGFTPKANISSHLRRPDGAEYPVLPLLTNERGEFSHEIETLVLTIGIHELWVIDDASKTPSNRVQLEVTAD
jgi:hypothetical protein